MASTSKWRIVIYVHLFAISIFLLMTILGLYGTSKTFSLSLFSKEFFSLISLPEIVRLNFEKSYQMTSLLTAFFVQGAIIIRAMPRHFGSFKFPEVDIFGLAIGCTHAILAVLIFRM
jgi:hypothetical protein